MVSNAGGSLNGAECASMRPILSTAPSCPSQSPRLPQVYIVIFNAHASMKTLFRGSAHFSFTMKPLSYLPAVLAICKLTLAAPARPAPPSSSTTSASSGASSPLDCSQYTPVESGNFIVNPDQWGQVSSTTCVQTHPSSDGSVSWSAQWSWPNGGASVKSYPNAELSNWQCKPLSSYNNIESSWTWE